MRPPAALVFLVLACECREETPTGVEAPDPGSVTLHRLNRAEYNNTVRDLLGTDLRPADDFPPDDHGYGYDNIADVLSTSPLHVELYEWAADLLVDEALDIPLSEPLDLLWEAEDEEALEHSTGGGYDGYWNLWSDGSISTTVEVPVDGTYTLSARVWGQQAADEGVMVSLDVNGLSIETFEVWEESDDPVTLSVDVALNRGVHQLSVTFLNDYYVPENGEDRNLIVDWLAFTGPADPEVLVNPIREALVTCEPSSSAPLDCAAEILEPFATRAWRRPVTEAELDGLLDLVSLALDEEDSFDAGLGLGMKAVLMSPHFLYRVELDPDPDDPTTHPLTAWELATRLSYFLWSSMPDAELFAAAADGSLMEDEVLEVQVRRMLADPRAEALVDNLAGQWLYIRAIDDTIPDSWTYPDFDEDLRDAMQVEMEVFFQSFITDDRPITELLTATESWVEPRLAAHYGLEVPDEGQWMDVSAVGRGGVLTQAGLLTALSHPTRTSPVRRGKWVLGQLLCMEPPPPPAGVEALPEDTGSAGSMREQLERHRTDPSCNSCHQMMDPIGLGLESYDGIGAWRTHDADGLVIDATGELPDGRSFNGAGELSAVIADDEHLAECVAEQISVYALGRGLTGEDEPYQSAITARFREGELRFSELIVAIVLSEPFRARRAVLEEDAE
ncbi:MAG: DUF1592 domain-containing protein [Alphaproteobacteria bacterium]|nr:DUF1592 domain-containing protein [Alphaproteobacteria bacterium]